VTNTAFDTSPEQQRSLERFYHHEARLLDSRQYKQWLELIAEDIVYVMPSRINVQVDNRQRGEEDMIAIENELEDADSIGCPLREENYVHLTLRVERAYKVNSWSENPPARSRRIIGNVELMRVENEAHHVVSNFILYYARPGGEDCIYSGQRKDLLLNSGRGFVLKRRKIIMDYADIQLPTLGLLL